ncbi:MAG: PHB depolymerase family esterase [Hydrococcus sp. Prado102]|jgi:poly(hydroxyalkanoate) depolymerase family esterase|nr:PHB depolymerase family esterase [Hydrococcus sp. Prado102]
MKTQMAEATRLTRAGKLKEATALIQRTLGGMRSAQDTSDSNEAIDVPFQAVDETPPNRSSGVAGLLKKAKGILTDKYNQKEQASRHQNNRHKNEQHAPQESKRNEVLARGQFIDGSYSNQAGTRSYKLYIPSGYSGQALPLVVMLHGCSQNPDDFAAGSRMNIIAENQQFFVVYPTQNNAANPSKCWNWFKSSDQQRGRGEPSIIAGITKQIASTYNINAERVYVAGLSAGGAMAATMGALYPELYAAIGVHSGLAYGAARDLPSAFAAMQKGKQTDNHRRQTQFVPTIVFHGDRDTTVNQCNAEQVLGQWGEKNLRASKNQQQVPNGRSYTRIIYRDKGDRIVMEQWLVHGAGHAWSGGSPHGSFTDPKGPDASLEMVRFFFGVS